MTNIKENFHFRFRFHFFSVWIGPIIIEKQSRSAPDPLDFQAFSWSTSIYRGLVLSPSIDPRLSPLIRFMLNSLNHNYIR